MKNKHSYKYFCLSLITLIIGCTSPDIQYKGQIFPKRDANGKYGYVDTLGKYIILPKYYSASDFNDKDKASVVIRNEDDENRFGIINNKGKWIVAPNIFTYKGSGDYKTIGQIDENNDTTYAIINREFEITKLSHVSDIGQFDYGIYATAANEERKWGIINHKGEWICLPKYDEIGYIGKLILAKTEGKIGYINSFGEIIIPFEYEQQSEKFEDDIDFEFMRLGFTILKKNGQYSIIDTIGKKVFPHSFDEYRKNIEGKKFISVKFQGKWGIASTTNDWIIRPNFEEITQLMFQNTDTLVAVKGIKNGKEIIIDRNNFGDKIFYCNDYLGAFQNFPIQFTFSSSHEFSVSIIYNDTTYNVGGILNNIPFENRLVSFAFDWGNNRNVIEVKGKFSENHNSFSGTIKIRNEKPKNFSVKKVIEYQKSIKDQYFLEIIRPVFTDKRNVMLTKYQRIIDNELKKLEELHLKEHDNFENPSDYENLKGEALFSVQSTISVDVIFASNKAFSITTNKSYLRWMNGEIKNYIIWNGQLIAFDLGKYIKPSLNIDWLYYCIDDDYFAYGKIDTEQRCFWLSMNNFNSFNFSPKGLTISYTYQETRKNGRYQKSNHGEGNLIRYEILKPFLKPEMFSFLNKEHSQFW